MTLSAQSTHYSHAADDPSLTALRTGTLNVWVVRKAAPGWKPAGSDTALMGNLPTTMAEQTAGSFGTASSNYGQTASTYGHNASSVGSNASDVGQTAGSVGQTAGNFGTASSNYGTASSNYGQTAGSYGQTAGSFSGTGTAAPGATTGPRLVRGSDPVWSATFARLRTDFPELHTHVSTVREEDLVDALQATQGTTIAPDLLLISPNGWSWAETGQGAAWSSVMVPLGALRFPSQMEGLTGATITAALPTVLRGAGHPLSARAFAVWLQSFRRCDACTPIIPASYSDQERLAAAAARSVLVSDTADGSADSAYATSDASLVRAEILQGPHTVALDSLQLRSDVIDSVSGDVFALVSVRVTAEVNSGFGVVQAMVVERRDNDGNWHVLHVTPDMSASMEMRAKKYLSAYAITAEKVVPAEVVTLDSPKDGAFTTLRPELGWEHKGAPTLEVIEWQRGGPEHWGAASMFLVPDDGQHLRTRATADFVARPGQYRWRVWALSPSGDLAVSEWSSFAADH